MEDFVSTNQQDTEFTIRKIEDTGEQFKISKEASQKLDDHTLLKLYTPVKKYFIREHRAPVCLNIHRKRDGVACLDFIMDSRCPKDFDESKLVEIYLQVVEGYIKSSDDLEEYRKKIRYTIPLLAGKPNKTGTVISIPVLQSYYSELAGISG
ncbi:hypothetical protein IJH97_02365 [Candidatus Saccharibacteria bacterium]|nr:hypothetical protein [Candidatus Saccharibacteria bacterium]